MALRDDLLPVVDFGRQLAQDLGLRTSRVYVRTITWTGNEVGFGTSSVVDVELLPRPKVLDLPGGRVQITRITPDFTAGGYTPAELMPADEIGKDVRMVVVGPDGEERIYRIESSNSRGAFRYEFVLERIPPDLATPDF